MGCGKLVTHFDSANEEKQRQLQLQLQTTINMTESANEKREMASLVREDSVLVVTGGEGPAASLPPVEDTESDTSTLDERIEIIDDTDFQLPPSSKDGEKMDSQKIPHDASDVPPDGGLQAWLAIFGAFMINFIAIGLPYSYGVFQRAYLKLNVFPGATSTQLALVGGLFASAGFLAGPLIGAMVVKLGPRVTSAIGAVLFTLDFIACSFATELWTIILCQGVIFGVTTNMTWVPGMSMPASWFSKKRGLATGLAVSGGGFGGLALSALTQVLIDRLGFRWALRVLAIGGGIICLACSTLIGLRKVPTGPISAARPPTIDFNLFRNAKFLALFTMAFFVLFFANVPFQFSPLFASSVVGADGSTASLVLGVMNGSSSVGRILLGLLSDKLGPQNILLMVTSTCVLAVLALWMPCHPGSLGLLFTFAGIYGMAGGALFSILPTVLASTMGTSNFSTKIGMLYMSFAFGGLAGPPLGGLSLDKTGGWRVMQGLTAGFWGIGVACVVLLRWFSCVREVRVACETEGKAEDRKGWFAVM